MLLRAVHVTNVEFMVMKKEGGSLEFPGVTRYYIIPIFGLRIQEQLVIIPVVILSLNLRSYTDCINLLSESE